MITLFLATVIGWYLVIVSLCMLFKYDHVQVIMADVMAQRALLFVLAIITLILGLIMVVSHNIWVMGWPVVITLFCWLVLLSGLVRLLCPDTAVKMGQWFLEKPMRMKVVAIINLVIGLFFLYQVYFPMMYR